MDTDTLLAQAHQKIATRQQAAHLFRATSRLDQGQGPVRWLLSGGLMTIIGCVVSTPGSFPQKLQRLLGGLCSLRPGHSYFSGTLQQPMEARMIGIYGGFFLTLLTLIGMRKLGASHIGNRFLSITLIIGAFSMVGDGINSTLAEVQRAHLYAPTNFLRLLTGLGFGLSSATWIVWLGAAGLPSSKVSSTSILEPHILGVLASLLMVFMVVVLQNRSALYPLVAFISVGGVLTLLGSVAFIALIRLFGLRGAVQTWGQVVAPGMLGLLIACVIIVGSAVVRWGA